MKIGIVGTGRLGICKALCLDAVGYEVVCYDMNKDHLTKIKNKTIKSNEPFVIEMLHKSNIKVAEDEDDILYQCDIIFIYIQTPSTAKGNYDHSFIDMFVDKCIKLGKLSSRKIIALSSTVMPEYTNTVHNRLYDLNYDVCYNPTFIAQGNVIDNLINPNLVLIGSYSEIAANHVRQIHETIIKNDATIHIMSPYEAEITKMSINCFITTKIAFANMIGDLLTFKNLDPTKVLKAIGSDNRIGNKCLNYGYGFGGPCFPRDNRALSVYGKSQCFDFKLCTTIDELNESHLIFQYNSLKSSKIPIEFNYITYKDTSDILEESQKLKLAIMLADYGLQIIIKERPYIIEILKNKYGNKFEYSII